MNHCFSCLVWLAFLLPFKFACCCLFVTWFWLNVHFLWLLALAVIDCCCSLWMLLLVDFYGCLMLSICSHGCLSSQLLSLVVFWLLQSLHCSCSCWVTFVVMALLLLLWHCSCHHCIALVVVTLFSPSWHCSCSHGIHSLAVVHFCLLIVALQVLPLLIVAGCYCFSHCWLSWFVVGCHGCGPGWLLWSLWFFVFLITGKFVGCCSG